MADLSGAPQPSVVVVIVTYNSADDIAGCLTSLLSATHALDLSVVVVDNASTDDTVARARDLAGHDPRIRVVANSTNVGFGAACNQGAALVATDFVVLLNPDTVTLEGAIDSLVEVTGSEPTLGPVGGQTLDPAGTLDPRSVQNAPTLVSLLSWALAVPLWARRVPGLGRWAQHPDLLDPSQLQAQCPVEVVIGCLLCLRREHWERLGGFDERYFLYCEDVDLSLRASELGLTPTFTPAARIVHQWGSSSPTFGRKIVALMRGRATLLRGHWSPGRARAGIALISFGIGVRALGERMRGRRGGWSEAFAARAEWTPGWPPLPAGPAA